jgi:tetratricopeptide (TPR) repeat protein
MQRSPTRPQTATAEELLAILLALPREDRRSQASAARRFRSRPLCELLIVRSHELRYADAEQMEELANLALAVAGQLDAASVGGPAALQDLRARACAHLGNAFRVRGRFTAAGRALERAQAHRLQGSHDLSLEALVLELTASLLESRRDFRGALERLELACAIHEQRADGPALAKALVQTGIVWGYANRPATGVRLLYQAIGWIDTKREPRLAFIALHALAWNLAGAGYAQEALEVHLASLALADHARSPLMELKVVWLQGHLAAELGRDGVAESDLSRALHGYEELEMPYEAALVSLELALLYARSGRFAALDSLTREILPIFEALGIEPEAHATVLLRRSARQRERSVELLSQVITAVKLQPHPAAG